MKHRAYLVLAVAVAALLIAALVWAAYQSIQQPAGDSSGGIAEFAYRIVATYPHDTSAYTEGLIFTNGVLYESTGGAGTSTLRQVNLEDGTIQAEVTMPSDDFGEGLAAVDGELFQLTWLNHVGYIYELATLSLQRNFSVPGEGWGLTYDGTHLIQSNGSQTLTFLDPNTLQPTGTINVHSGNSAVTSLNELEYINGTLYANVWPTARIALINPQNGKVTGWIDLSDLEAANNPTHNSDNVLNGIAYDVAGGRLFVTGKDWPNLYQIEITPAS